MRHFFARYRKLLAASVGILAIALTAVSIADNKADPLKKQMDSFERVINLAFREKAATDVQLANMPFANSDDTLIGLETDSLKKLVHATRQMKDRIEAVSKEREALAQNDPLLRSLAQVIVRYYRIQRRLYGNYLRNVHSPGGSEGTGYPNMYDDLNLLVSHNVGLKLALDECGTKDEPDKNDACGLKYNVAHVRDLYGRFGTVEVRMTPQDKDFEEQKALQSLVDQKSYAKLVHFSALRSRIVNHWALQRMSIDSVLPDPDLHACGRNLVSFKYQNLDSERDYFSALKADDRYGDFAQKIKGIANATLDLPLFDEDTYASIMRQFYFSIPNFAGTPDHPGLSLQQLQFDKAEDEYYGAKLTKDLNAKLNDLWSKDADDAVKTSSFLGDKWEDPGEIADRVAWIAYKRMKDLFITQIHTEVTKVDKNGKGGKMWVITDNISDKDPDPAVWKLIHQAVDPKLNLEHELRWKKALRERILAYLKSKPAVELTRGLTQTRFTETFEKALPSMTYGARAVRIRDQINNLQKTAQGCVNTQMHNMSDSGMLYKSSRPECKYYNSLVDDSLRLAYNAGDDIAWILTPARSALPERLSPWTPDQLSTYFFKKLGYLAEQKDLYDLHERAEKIGKESAVMKGISNFFAHLQESFGKKSKARKWKPDDIEGGRQMLLEAIREESAKAFGEFNQLMDQPPEHFEQPDRYSYQRWAGIKVDATYVKPPAVPPVKSDSRVGKSKDEALTLYYEAMSLMGILQPTLGRKSVENPNLRYQAKKLYTLEKLLDPNNQEKLEYRLAMSVMDQKFLAETLIGVALSETPALALQLWNDEDAPQLIHSIAKGYSFNKGLDKDHARNWYLNGVNIAIKNERTLVKEACLARPTDNSDDRWRNIFRASEKTRGELITINKRYEAIDKQIAKDTRSGWVKFYEDWLTPFADLAFKAGIFVMIALATGGIGGFIEFGIVEGAWQAGVATLFRSVGIESIAALAENTTGGLATFGWFIVKATTNSLIGSWAMRVFSVQILLLGYNSYYVLPGQLQYNLGVANSEVGLYTKVTADRKAIKQFADQIHGQKVSFWFQAALQSLFVGKSTARTIKTFFGKQVEAAVDVLSEAPGGAALAQDIKVKSLSQHIEESGYIKGPIDWMTSKAKSLWDYGRISTVAEGTTQAEADTFMRRLLKKFFPATVEAQSGHVVGSLDHYEQSVQLVIDDIDRQASRYIHMVGAIQNGELSVPEEFRLWVMDKLAPLFTAGGEYAEIAETLKAKNLVTSIVDVVESADGSLDITFQDGGHFTTKNIGFRHNWELLIRAHLEGKLLPMRNYWTQKLQILGEYKAAAQDGSDVLDKFFGNFTREDIMMHRRLLESIQVIQAGGVLQGWWQRNFAASPALKDFKKVWNAYDDLSHEISLVENKAAKGAATAAGAGGDPAAKGPKDCQTCYNSDPKDGGHKIKELKAAAGGTGTGGGAKSGSKTAQKPKNLETVTVDGQPVIIDGKELQLDVNSIVRRSNMRPGHTYQPVMIDGKPAMVGGEEWQTDVTDMPKSGKPAPESVQQWDIDNAEDLLVIDVDANGVPTYSMKTVGEVPKARGNIMKVLKRNLGLK